MVYGLDSFFVTFLGMHTVVEGGANSIYVLGQQVVIFLFAISDFLLNKTSYFLKLNKIYKSHLKILFYPIHSFLRLRVSLIFRSMDPYSSAKNVLRCDLCEIEILHSYCDFFSCQPLYIFCKPCVVDHI